ncbi:MAG: ABC transporter permease subunit [Oligoflexia bacterium]|nr:ABC transporter permease subunit [Oligoflexia bacterium]
MTSKKNNESRISRIFSFNNLSISLTILWPVIFVLIPFAILTTISFLVYDDVNFFKMQFTLENYKRLVKDDYLPVLLNSLVPSLITTIITLVISYPLTFFITRKFSKKTQKFLIFLVIIPYWTSSLLRSYGIRIILGTEGILNTILIHLKIISAPLEIIYTPTAVIVGFVYLLIPLMILPLYSTMEKLDSRLIEAAYDLKASKLQTFLKVIWPLTLPGVTVGSFMVFLPSMGMFYVADILGGAKSILIGNLVKGQFLEVRNWPMGATLNTLILVFLLLFLLIYKEKSHWGHK